MICEVWANFISVCIGPLKAPIYTKVKPILHLQHLSKVTGRVRWMHGNVQSAFLPVTFVSSFLCEVHLTKSQRV
jgi:hypothetical protein